MTMTNGDVSQIRGALGCGIIGLNEGNDDPEQQEWTDLHCWRLYAEKGRHIWKYLESDEELLEHPEQRLREKQLQMEDESWGSNCDGPMFITSGIVFACYLVGVPIPRPLRREMCRYLVNTCNADGGWGIYLSGPSTVFGTVINYVMLRLLDLGPSHPTCKKARELLTSMGGVLGIPTWSRFWLCLQLAVDSLIGLESGESSFGAYEKVRGWELLEHCNVTDTYENCMIKRRYAETTGSVLTALTEFKAEYPDYRQNDICRCINGGAAYLLQSQYQHGGWIGTWGVCFSFATMWALQGLACAGYTEQNSPAVAKACAFLLRHQNPDDGDWGEALKSYRARDYVAEPEGSQVPNTAYAVIALLAAQCANQAAIERGVVYLTKTQQSNGEWLPGTLEGIYTPPCGYRYPLYKFHFTLKALARMPGDTGILCLTQAHRSGQRLT
ncbi:terpenoid cyclases/protein prenyltransferase alpha-alpha toroid [Xylaria sp. FL1042]|nr:terpenoid cyclases/protein prenyltransferase alpha-alpha toroid [Xylaria sp. FL1042]